jgi:hypothetical protein
MATIRCPNGHEISEEGSFCPVCGVRVREELLTTHDEKAAPAPMPSSATPLHQRRARTGWSSLGRKTKIVILVGGALFGLALLGAALPDSNNSSDNTASAIATDTTTSTSMPSVEDRDGYDCPANETKYGLCPDSPYFGKKPAAARHARHQAAVAEARREAARRARAEARARVRAARIAAANAWHQGYYQQDDNVYWKWAQGSSCADYAVNGCWHVQVVTRDGCPSYVAVNANEYQGGTIINQLLDNQGFGIPPKTPRMFELLADGSGGSTADDVLIDCS